VRACLSADGCNSGRCLRRLPTDQPVDETLHVCCPRMCCYIIRRLLTIRPAYSKDASLLT
jgi:hypothetical protein